MQTSRRSAAHTARSTADAATAWHEGDAERKSGEHPDDWREDRLSLAIRVIEALGLRPVGSAPVLH